MLNFMRDTADKRAYHRRATDSLFTRWREELIRDPDRVAFWFVVTLVGIAVAHGWLR